MSKLAAFTYIPINLVFRGVVFKYVDINVTSTYKLRIPRAHSSAIGNNYTNYLTSWSTFSKKTIFLVYFGLKCQFLAKSVHVNAYF